MFKIINYLQIFLVLLTNVIAQSQPFEIDSTQENSSPERNEYKLFLNPFLNTNKIFLGQDDFKIYDDSYLIPPQNPDSMMKPNNLAQLKLLIDNYMQQRRNLLPNYDLGEFGKYLGYANTLAVVLLAIAHISKYGFK